MNKAELSGGDASQVQMEPVENQIIVYQPDGVMKIDVVLTAKQFGYSSHR